MARWHRPRLVLLLAAGVLVAGCSPAPGEPSVGVSVTAQGEAPRNDCERSVVARAEYLRDHGLVGSEALESDIFATCTYAEFQAANAKMADKYRYPGEGRAYIGRSCVRLYSLYRGSRLCQSR